MAELEPFELSGISGQLLVVDSEHYVSIMLALDGRAHATISADELFEGHRWWLDRLHVVNPALRRKGIGAFLVARLKSILQKKDNFKRLEVVPGGYDTNYEDLVTFYTKQGFRLVEPDGLFAWP